MRRSFFIEKRSDKALCGFYLKLFIHHTLVIGEEIFGELTEVKGRTSKQTGSSETRVEIDVHAGDEVPAPLSFIRLWKSKATLIDTCISCIQTYLCILGFVLG